jgi:hypothetical protein
VSDQASPRDYPTAHLPSLFLRTLRTSTAKGGLVFGEPSPLLPWLSALMPASESARCTPAASSSDEIQRVPPERVEPSWLQLSLIGENSEQINREMVFKLRTISNVGFGFGQQCPW